MKRQRFGGSDAVREPPSEPRGRRSFSGFLDPSSFSIDSDQLSIGWKDSGEDTAPVPHTTTDIQNRTS